MPLSDSEPEPIHAPYCVCIDCQRKRLLEQPEVRATLQRIAEGVASTLEAICDQVVSAYEAFGLALPPPHETPAARALRLRRERNTGPARSPLDGRRRRSATRSPVPGRVTRGGAA